MPNVFYYIDDFENQLRGAKSIANWDEVDRISAILSELKSDIFIKAPKLSHRN